MKKALKVFHCYQFVPGSHKAQVIFVSPLLPSFACTKQNFKTHRKGNRRLLPHRIKPSREKWGLNHHVLKCTFSNKKICIGFLLRSAFFFLLFPLNFFCLPGFSFVCFCLIVVYLFTHLFSCFTSQLQFSPPPSPTSLSLYQSPTQFLPPNPLLLQLSSGKDTSPIKINKAWYTKLQ